ncbi:MAG: type II restriction endonuclease [Erysipelotrichaceae bacterium]|nr:type II restriction endonuclease [Solobacterium sp.]MCI7445190.1 type II restriction endonuclease [Solobacterium sp.]MDY2638908.1 type II restriction endonuclease [Ligilactobacillus salivarius]MDY3794790.1 type II restriction endonuclease [Erysipelotrichaceae bacterium]
MAKRNFNEWLGTFRESINGFKYYTDFETVYKNAEKYKIELNILNSLVGSQTIKKDFTNLIEKYPECLKAIPLLLAVRENEMYCQDEIVSKNFAFHEPYDEITDYIYFMEHTGLFDLIQNHLVSNLYDYVTGVEVGLGSNGRKNRGGHQMEDLVEGFIKETECEYYKEMYLQDIEKKWNIDLSSISANNTTTKRWDFVVKTENHIYVIETNFYAAGGSKLNETARSYKMIAEESKNIKNFSFVWITDGGGWRSARRNLEETFNVLDNLYNIYDLESLVLEKLFG